MHLVLFFRVSQKLHKSTKYIVYFPVEALFFDKFRDEKFDFQQIFHFLDREINIDLTGLCRHRQQIPDEVKLFSFISVNYLCKISLIRMK